MKKLFFILCICFSILSCTSNEMAKHYGGTTTVNVEKGYKVIEATWKDNQLWYLTEPMESNYTPKDKKFVEDSEFGMLEGTVIFHESK